MSALGQLLLAFERQGRPDPRRWSNTYEGILVAVMDAKLSHRKPSLRDIADAGDIPLGTVKSAKSRHRDFAREMHMVGRGPFTATDYWEIPDGATTCKRFAQSRPQWEWAEWSRLYNCKVVHRRQDEDEPQDYMRYDEWPDVSGRDALERLWGDSATASAHAALLDSCHRFHSGDLMPWQAHELQGASV